MCTVVISLALGLKHLQSKDGFLELDALHHDRRTRGQGVGSRPAAKAPDRVASNRVFPSKKIA